MEVKDPIAERNNNLGIGMQLATLASQVPPDVIALIRARGLPISLPGVAVMFGEDGAPIYIPAESADVLQTPNAESPPIDVKEAAKRICTDCTPEQLLEFEAIWREALKKASE